MQLYKHYSFDLWLTLIKSNPDFKKERALFFYRNFNFSPKKSIEEIEKIFRHVDIICNAINEKTGKNIDADEMYLMVIYLINDGSAAFLDINLEKLYQEMETLVFNYLPILYSNETPEILKRIKESNISTIGILSNTAFIKGQTLRRVLEKLQIAQYFDFQLYSDEVGLSKPNRSFFDVMIQTAFDSHNESPIKLNDIIHIGDNPKADIEGGLLAGVNVFQINSNDKTILNLLN
ncbi:MULTISPECIES: HAD family hydrolase [Emticicia]|uniref:HAD family hydrolase n=1 Tax=Emticicia TaxID=312278 RepID=UPI0020A0A398|nr:MULTISPECIES: HAD family hydrolase [Emticicia]UTA66912.1 HAD family hydrolase [Emticicia sp. 21SJ11W-3]